MSIFVYSFCVILFFILFFIPLPWHWLGQHPLQKNYDKTYEHLTQYLRGHHFTSEKEIDHPFSGYKNFRTMIESCLDFARKYGSPYREPLDFLRLKMVEDFRFEKKIYSLCLGSLFQFGVVGVMTWLMALGFKFILEFQLPLLPFCLIFLWQLLGVIVFIKIFYWKKRAIFSGPETMFQIAIKLLSLSQVGLSFNKVLQFSGYDQLQKLKEKDLASLVDLLDKAVERTIKQGAPIKEELLMSLSEWQFVLDRRCELFYKQLEVMKLAVLALFFVSSYFFLIYQMVSLGLQ